jgi:hypothetical protein
VEKSLIRVTCNDFFVDGLEVCVFDCHCFFSNEMTVLFLSIKNITIAKTEKFRQNKLKCYKIVKSKREVFQKWLL